MVPVPMKFPGLNFLPDSFNTRNRNSLKLANLGEKLLVRRVPLTPSGGRPCYI